MRKRPVAMHADAKKKAKKKTARDVAEKMSLDDLLGADVLGGDLSDPKTKTKAKRSESGSSDDTGSLSSLSDSDDGSSDVEFEQEDIERLKEQDPDFYKYLKDTDEGLLDFRDEDDSEDDRKDEGGEDDDDDDDDDGDDGEDDDDGEDNNGGERIEAKASGVVTSESLKSWCHAAQKNASVGAVRQVTRLYRIACHYGDEEDDDESLKLASSAVYNNILLFMLGKADGMFRKALGMSADDDDDDPTKRARYTKYAPFIRSYLGNTLHLLDKMTDPSMQGYILKRLRHSVTFLRDFDKIRRKFIALSLKIFSSAEDEPRVQAILFVRACAITLPTLCLDPCLKGVYKSFVAASKFFSPASAPGIRFMATCSVGV
jgi:nucleolar complex protein 2